MEKQLSVLYGQITELLSSMIPTDWDKIYLLGEVEKDQLSYSSTFYYTDSDTKNIVKCVNILNIYDEDEDTFIEALSELGDLIFALNNCFKENEQELWEQVVFVLDNDGSINIDYKYDVMVEDDGGQMGREVIWAYDTFGYIPDEDSYEKVLLDKHLKSRK
ncbi:MAG: antitoxin YezG family protein [Firmicutes bacterium]|nr:antitoxin YezG family protein [Bacillota bacterium]